MTNINHMGGENKSHGGRGGSKSRQGRVCFGFLFCIYFYLQNKYRGTRIRKNDVSGGPEIIYQNWISTPTHSPHTAPPTPKMVKEQDI